MKVSMLPLLLPSGDFRNGGGEVLGLSKFRVGREGFSKPLWEVGLLSIRLPFSCPAVSGAYGGVVEGIKFPVSGAAFSARFSGLLGETRARVNGREGDVRAFAERSERRTLGRKGVNSDWCEGEQLIEETIGGADCVCEGSGCCCGVALKRRQGDWGEACRESEVCELYEWERDRSLEGDLERERRKLRTADVTSIWWACVGDGRAKVPPLLLEKDMLLS